MDSLPSGKKPPPGGLVRFWRNHPARARGAVLAAGLLFFGFRLLGEPWFWGLHLESRRAQIAREMMGRSWLVPTLNGQPIYTKPPLFYWLEILSFQAAGHADERSARIPSAVLGSLCVALAALAARLRYGSRAGLAAASVLVSVPLYLQYLRLAEIDMAACAFTTAALCALLLATPTKQAWFFWTSLGFACLAKGPVAPVLLFGGVAVCSVRERSWRLWKTLLVSPAPLAFAAICVPYYALLFSSAPEAVDPLLEEADKHGFLLSHLLQTNPAKYLEYLPCLGPWAAALPAALVWSWKSRDAGDRLLSGFVAAGMATVSLLATKKPAYLLPLIPAASLLTARWLAAGLSPTWEARVLPACRWTAAATALACAGFATFAAPSATVPGLAEAGLLTLLCAGAAWSVRRARDPVFAAAGTAVVLLLAASVFWHHTLPAWNTRHSIRPFARQINERVPAQAPVFRFHIDHTGLPFYTGRKMPAFSPETSAPSRYVVTRRRWLRTLSGAGPVETLLEGLPEGEETCLLVRVVGAPPPDAP